jgi:hypothetical protein
MARGRIKRIEAGLLLATAAGLLFLWDTLAVYPLRLLVVFFHELSHGVAAMATGGAIEEIRIVAGEGGVCVTRGGNRFLVLTAGYLGSLVCGGLILGLASRTHADKFVAAALGVLLVVVSAVWVRPVISFGFGFGAATGIGLVLAGAFLPRVVNDFVLKLIGLTSCLYALYDIKSDVLDRPGIESDAAMLADLTGLPTRFWGALWITIAAAGGLYFLWFACRGPVPPSPQTESITERSPV